MTSGKGLSVKRFASQAEWEAWLREHHETSTGVWLELAKKGNDGGSLSRAQALESYASQRTMAVPADLRERLDAHPRARRSFEQLDSRNRYAILYRLHDAKKPETRQRRLAKFIRMLEAGETLH